MHLVVLASGVVAFDKARAEAGADLGEDGSQVSDRQGRQHIATGLRNEDQVRVESKTTALSNPVVVL